MAGPARLAGNLELQELVFLQDWPPGLTNIPPSLDKNATNWYCGPLAKWSHLAITMSRKLGVAQDSRHWTLQHPCSRPVLGENHTFNSCRVSRLSHFILNLPWSCKARNDSTSVSFILQGDLLNNTWQPICQSRTYHLNTNDRQQPNPLTNQLHILPPKKDCPNIERHPAQSNKFQCLSWPIHTDSMCVQYWQYWYSQSCEYATFIQFVGIRYHSMQTPGLPKDFGQLPTDPSQSYALRSHSLHQETSWSWELRADIGMDHLAETDLKKQRKRS